MVGPVTFQFINIAHEIRTSDDWNRIDLPKLWLYNAHYFDDLIANDANLRTTWHTNLINRWINENPIGNGNGWEPYPSSLRIVNWIKWVVGGGDLSLDAQHSLAIQSRYLCKHLEYHLLGNHLWANAKALIFSGAFFKGTEPDRWRDKGLSLIEHELSEQILPDGGHFERSPMYHSIILEDILDLIQLSHCFPGTIPATIVEHCEKIASRMYQWLRIMTHPDGGISFFNDAALSIAPTLTALEHYSKKINLRLPSPPLKDIEPLPDSGYVRMQAGPAVLIADVGEIGPDYLPGHAHADTLSFELSLHGHRFLVNGGTSTYENGDARSKQRGTPSHNTVTVDNVDSSEVWSSFRVAKRARPIDVSWGMDGDNVWLSAAHDGYKRLRGKVIHQRRWMLSPDKIDISDTLLGTKEKANAYFRFNPEWSIDGSHATHPCKSEAKWHIKGSSLVNIRETLWHPHFGEDIDCKVLEIEFEKDKISTTFSWDHH